MKVTVSGKTNKDLSKRLITATKFFANILMDPRMVRGLNINIILLKQNELLGLCEVLDHGKTHRNFNITIRNDILDDPFVTLAHEMVHVKQYAKKELGTEIVLAKGSTPLSIVPWQGKLWKPKSKEDPYYDAPWEIEAYGREQGLIERWQLLQNKKVIARKACKQRKVPKSKAQR